MANETQAADTATVKKTQAADTATVKPEGAKVRTDGAYEVAPGLWRKDN